MDQQNQNNTPDGSGDVPLKRKRGRPRKYPRPDLEDGSYISHSYSKKLNSVSGEPAVVHPGFQGANVNQHFQRNQENDAMIGQAVSGVIEAVFDAGYLLSVRVGDSDTTLRGLVFKPGRYVPISSENDVAPGVPMIRRDEVPIPSGTAQFQNPLPKERNEQHANINRNDIHAMNGSPSLPLVPRTAAGSSNSVVTLGNNAPTVAGQTAPQIPGGSGASVAKEIPAPDGNQALTSQTSQNILSSSMQCEAVPHHQSSNLPTEELKTMRVPNAPFEQLVTEVVKRIEAPSDVMDVDTDNSKPGDKTQLKEPSCRQEEKVNDMDQPVLIRPLQAVQSHPQENTASAPQPSDFTKTGKMTQLLQMLQDNKPENQASKAADLGSGFQLDDVRNLGT
ncbi:protein METABOLIC NETWORK MODULATOR 1 isoform X3 [Arachis duranensis]|uniref:Protein METABOLIC NETWORK MODULATOR 1 isoform X3 n=1 Tax=Arachis duranensis TaxID=130453 RepID=A0A9C6WRZ1_ARADU|nr:protein METABOLIC NETWORK MODULATOR 1 isoform X3 [Arachis duranensis]